MEYFSRTQRLFAFLFFPFRASMERDSRGWKVVCPCGFRKSVWEDGGIRWHASGNPRHKLRCEACGQRQVQPVVWDPD